MKAKYGDIQKMMKPKKKRRSEKNDQKGEDDTLGSSVVFLQEWFDELKEENDKIGPEGVEKLCNQLGNTRFLYIRSIRVVPYNKKWSR